MLIFQGGGYDGCIWEWNAIFFKPGTPRLPEEAQPGVSGRAGDRVLQAAKEGGLQAAVRAAKAEYYGRDKGWHLCTTDKSWEEFDAEFNEGFVRNVCKIAGRQCRCDKCQQWFDADEIVHTGYRGDSGIGIVFNDNHCTECADELHEEYCAKHVWKYESLDTRVQAIQQHNTEYGDELSVFAARREEAPVSYRYYTSEPDYH